MPGAITAIKMFINSYTHPNFGGPLISFLPPFQSHLHIAESRENRRTNEPLAVISLRRTGWREYSLASARRTSFFTIWSCSPPLPRIVTAVNSEVSSASAKVSGSSSWSMEGEGEGRRREGGGEGEGSACCLYISQLRYYERREFRLTARRLRMSGMIVVCM